MPALSHIAAQFEIGCELREFAELGAGHINETYIGRGSGRDSFVFQRINQKIFQDVAALMENQQRICEHLHRKGVPCLTLIPTRGGASFYRDPGSGECWRSSPFIGGSSNLDGGHHSPLQAQLAAAAFGEFAYQLSDLPRPLLHEIIPDFHNTPKRFADLLSAVEQDPLNLAASAAPQIDSALARTDWVGRIGDAQAAGTIPERIAHNDAKIGNVLFDAAGREALCVVDLDTVMPGSLLHDFGDLVRSAAATAGEEECDLDRIGLSREAFTAIARGFVGACGQSMTATERELLPFAGKIIAYEQALRFLADHLLGDRYYRIQRRGQNLDRARNQLHLAAIIDREETALAGIVESL